MTREGCQLRVGDTVVSFGVCYRIDRITEYPGRFVGGHARVAYGDHWERTIADHELFECLEEVP
jgi:hypothetical protein